MNQHAEMKQAIKDFSIHNFMIYVIKVHNKENAWKTNAEHVIKIAF